MTKPDVSVVIPVLNEEDSVAALHSGVATAFAGTAYGFELIFVDDGSTDRTLARLTAIAAADRRVRVVKLARNFGQTPATAAGFDLARGRILVTLDGDLQNDPADIPLLLQHIESGCDMVVGWRRNRQDRWLSRKLPSRIANWLLATLTGVRIRDTGCALKAFRAEVIGTLPLYSDLHRFLPALMSTTGARIAQVPVNHAPRRFGASKYGLSRIFKVISDLMMLKAVLLSARCSSHLFFQPASVCAVLGVATLVSAVMTGEHLTVPATIGLLLVETAGFLGFLGVLTQLVYATGDLNPQSLSCSTMRIQDARHDATLAVGDRGDQ